MKWFPFGAILLFWFKTYSIDINNAIHYTIVDGLPTNNIHSIEQDSLGYLWIATEAGLSRFNGATFYNYTTKTGLAKNEISDLFKQRKRIFLASNGPFGYIEDGSIKYLNIPVEQKMNWNFSVTNDAHSIYLTSKNKLLNLDKNDLSYNGIKDFGMPLSFIGNYKNYIYAIRGSILYKLSNSHIVEEIHLSEETSLLYKQRAIHYLEKNNIFYINKNRLLCYDLETEGTKLIAADIPPLVRIKHYKNKIILIHLNGGYTEIIINKYLELIEQNIYNKDITFTDFELDTEGNKWFSTANQGIFFVPKKLRGISKVSSPLIENIESPTSLFVNGDSIWIGNSIAELILLHNNEVKKFTLPSLNSYGMSRILDIKELSTGDLIISADIGILLFTNNTFYYLFNTSSKKITVENKNIIINTYQSSYLLTEECLYHLVSQNILFDKSDFINTDCVEELDNGRSFVSAYGGNTIYVAKVLEGLVKIKDGNKTYLKDFNGIYNAEINDLAFLDENHIAVASSGEGFYISEIENPENVTYVDAVSSNVCYTLIRKDDRLFVGTNKGIYFVTISKDIENLQVQKLSQKHGLLSNEIRDFDLRDNKLFALSNKGINIVDLNDIAIFTTTPNLRIETLIVNQKDIQVQDSIYLEPHENDISFLYDKIDFSRSDNLNYAYRLIGMSEDWYFTNSTEAKYPNLKSGNYVFQVGIAQGGQVVEENIQQVHIHIRTAFMNSVWAKLIGLAFFLGGSYFFLLTIISRRNIKRLEHSVSERTLELNEKVKEIQLINHQLKMSNSELQKYAHIASHDLKSPLRTISSFITLLEKRNLHLFGKKDLEYVNFVKNGVTRMSNTVNDLLELSKVSTQTIYENTDLNKTISNILADLNFEISNKKAEIIVEPNLPRLKIQKTSAYQLFQNLISNAIKYNESQPPIVRISVEKDKPKFWVISVKDNGIGIEPEYQKDIFEIFRRLHGNDEYDGTGIGLALCKKIVNKYGGSIYLESEIGKGSTFLVHLPKK